MIESAYFISGLLIGGGTIFLLLKYLIRELKLLVDYAQDRYNDLLERYNYLASVQRLPIEPPSTTQSVVDELYPRSDANEAEIERERVG